MAFSEIYRPTTWASVEKCFLTVGGEVATNKHIRNTCLFSAATRNPTSRSTETKKKKKIATDRYQSFGPRARFFRDFTLLLILLFARDVITQPVSPVKRGLDDILHADSPRYIYGDIRAEEKKKIRKTFDEPDEFV